jgi:hypothetical protein
VDLSAATPAVDMERCQQGCIKPARNAAFMRQWHGKRENLPATLCHPFGLGKDGIYSCTGG